MDDEQAVDGWMQAVQGASSRSWRLQFVQMTNEVPNHLCGAVRTVGHRCCLR